MIILPGQPKASQFECHLNVQQPPKLEAKTIELQDVIDTLRRENAATLKSLEAALTTVTSRADRAEAQVEALQVERDRLIEDSKASQAL